MRGLGRRWGYNRGLMGMGMGSQIWGFCVDRLYTTYVRRATWDLEVFHSFLSSSPTTYPNSLSDQPSTIDSYNKSSKYRTTPHRGYLPR